MAECSAATILVKLSTRSGELNAFAVLAIATSIVAVSAIAYAISSGAFIEFFPAKLVGTLTIAVGALFKGLSLGPASVVVPVYGMFILGAALLGIVILKEPFTGSKAGGLALAVIGIFLVAR